MKTIIKSVSKCQSIVLFFMMLWSFVTFADVTKLSATEQLIKMRSGEISSVQMVKAYLSRIEQIDQKGPTLQSIISLNPDALSLAQLRDKQRENGNELGKLHGLVVLVKDNIETAELPTTAGSLALKNNFTKRDAPIIAKLKEQGAIVLGKTNLSEWANFRSESSISGWSGIKGQTKNPHSLDRTPCGSSSGTGAAIAARFSALGIGTETNGSIICPAAMNGIVGVKPTVGLWSRTHIVPISSTQDTAGPMTRTVADAALMLKAISYSDPTDSATLLSDKKRSDYTKLLSRSVSGKRIGVLRSRQSEHPEIIAAFNASLKALEKLGVVLVDIDQLEMPEDFWQKSYELLLIEFKHELNQYLASLPESIKNRSLAELIAFNISSPRELGLFDQSIFEKAQATKGYDEHYLEIKEYLRKTTRDDGIDKLLREYEVDALVAPSQTPAFLIDALFGDSFAGGTAGAGWLAAIAGYPQVSVPMGDMKGLPINFSFIGTAWDEALLLNLAWHLEQKTNALIDPAFRKNAFEQPKTKVFLEPQ